MEPSPSALASFPAVLSTSPPLQPIKINFQVVLLFSKYQILIPLKVKPAAAASKSLTTSWWFSFLALSRGLLKWLYSCDTSTLPGNFTFQTSIVCPSLEWKVLFRKLSVFRFDWLDRLKWNICCSKSLWWQYCGWNSLLIKLLPSMMLMRIL